MSLRLLLGLCCLGSLVLSASTVRASPSPYLGRDNPLLALLPSAPALSARERQRREHDIAQVLSELPQVERAEVLITQREPSATPLELAAPEYHAQVRLELSALGPSQLAIERVVRGLLPELAPGGLQVTSRLTAPPPVSTQALTRVGPFMVARESSAALRGTLALCLGANALLAALLLLRRRRVP